MSSRDLYPAEVLSARVNSNRLSGGYTQLGFPSTLHQGVQVRDKAMDDPDPAIENINRVHHSNVMQNTIKKYRIDEAKN